MWSFEKTNRLLLNLIKLRCDHHRFDPPMILYEPKNSEFSFHEWTISNFSISKGNFKLYFYHVSRSFVISLLYIISDIENYIASIIVIDFIIWLFLISTRDIWSWINDEISRSSRRFDFFVNCSVVLQDISDRGRSSHISSHIFRNCYEFSKNGLRVRIIINIFDVAI